MNHKLMDTRPRLHFWQIWNMCFGFFGIQVGWGLQNANVSRIFQSLGASVDDIPILWIAAPLTGLLIQPVVGYFSDHTWTRLGRRRPYFLYGAIMATLALFFMPNAPVLWVAAGTLWIMDASINITMEPFRAFVGDMLPNEQRTRGFATQSFFIGAGAVLSSALPWILSNGFSVSNYAEPGFIADAVRYSFYFGGVVFFCSVLWTVVSTREYSPEQLAAFNQKEQADSADQARLPETGKADRFVRSGTMWLAGGAILTWGIGAWSFEKELYVLGVGGAIFGLLQLLSAWLKHAGKRVPAFSEIMDDLFEMPRTMKQLAVVQFFSWFALFAMWIYSTAAVTSHHYGTTDVNSALYGDGADWVGVLFAAYNGFAALAAFAIPVMAAKTSRKITHSINLWLGGLGLISFILIKDATYLWVSMIGVGIAWASILSIPYSILAGTLPTDKMGVFMGIFNFFIGIPQIVAASILGILVRFVFDGEAIYALIMGGCSLFIAGIAVLFVDDPWDKRTKQ